MHVVFVLDRRNDEARLSVDEVDRVWSIIESGDLNGLSNLTLVEESTGPTSLNEYFIYLRQHIDSKCIKLLGGVAEDTADSPQDKAGLSVNMVSAYRGKADVVASVRDLVRNLAEGTGKDQSGGPGTGLEAGIAERTRLGRLPEPDLMVFFGGRKNLGEAGVWMGAYSEFAFLDEPWHSFNADDLTELLADFGLRERRFGAV